MQVKVTNKNPFATDGKVKYTTTTDAADRIAYATGADYNDILSDLEQGTSFDTAWYTFEPVQ